MKSAGKKLLIFSLHKKEYSLHFDKTGKKSDRYMKQQLLNYGNENMEERMKEQEARKREQAKQENIRIQVR